MPDDPNLFDDDDLLPSWMQELDSDQPDAPVESPAQPAAEAAGPPPTATPKEPPWQTHAADPPPPPKLTPPAAAPWDVHAGDEPPSPSTVQASTPWDVAGDAADLLAGLESGPPPTGEGAPADAPDLALDWTAPTVEGGDIPAGQGELPRGLTGQLPWRQEAQPQPPESSQPPPDSPAPAADDDDWLSAFGEAADAGAVPTGDTPDLDWLTASETADASPEAPAGGTQPLPSAAESEPVSLDDMLFDDDVAGEGEPEPSTTAAVPLDDLFDDTDLPDDQPSVAPDSIEADDLEDIFAALDGESDTGDTGGPDSGEEAAALPDWLGDVGAGEEDTAGTPTGSPEAAMPDWLGAAAEISDEDALETPEEAAPDWLAGELAEVSGDEGGSEELPAAPEPEEAMPAWLEQPAPPAERPKTGGIRRITGEADAVDAGADDTTPAWLETGDLPEDTAPAAGMSYEEWEARQRAEALEASKTPEDRLLEEVPDWFKGLEGEPPASQAEAPASAEEPEFVPGWFLGLEDQPEEEAPDWFGRLDLSTGPLEEPPELDQPPAPAPAPDDLDVPDWFKPGPELAGVNWAAVGATGDNPGHAPDPPNATGGEGEDEPPPWFESPGEEDVIPSPEEIPFPDLDLDQPMPGEPAVEEPPMPSEAEVEDFVERFEPLAPDSVPPAEPASADMPNWLRELGSATETPGETPLPEGVFGEAELPLPEPEEIFGEGDEGMDWLDSLSPEDVAAEADALFEMPSLPDIEEGAPSEAAPVEEALETTPLDSSALDALLGIDEEAIPPERALEPVETGLTPVEEPQPAAGEESLDELRALINAADLEGDVPDLEKLFDESAIEPMLSEAITGVPDVSADVEEQPPRMPETAPRFQPGPQGPARPVPEEPLPLAEEPQPEWVEDLRPSELPVTLKAGGTEAHVQQKQLAELPDRLRAFREEALRELQGVQPEAKEDEGPLAGIGDALPAVALDISQEAERLPDQLVITPEQQRRVERLQALLDAVAAQEEEIYEDRASFEEMAQMALEEVAAEEGAAPLAHRPRRRRRFKPDRLLVVLVMLVALLGPFASDALHFAADPPELAGDRAAVGTAIDALNPGDRVLFAFEYGPVSAGELDGLAEAVLRDVLARRAVPLTLSTDPAGAFHAEAVFAPLLEDAALLAARGEEESHLQRGEDFITLPYLPGEAVGVRALRSTEPDGLGGYQPHPAFEYDLRGDKVDVPVGNLEDDVALIVVVSEDSNAVRTWAEQLSGLDVPRVALVTAGVEPLVTPYVHEGAYQGYLAGARDTLAYNAERNADTRTPYRMPDDLPLDLPNPEESRWHSMALGALVAAGLIGLGTVINLLRALGRRRHR